MQRLILWDVDGTLLSTDGLSGQAMRAAAARVFGPVSPHERTFFSGKTDWQILLDMFPDVDAEAVAAKLPLFCEAYVEELEQRREALIARSWLFPGVREVVRTLGQQPGVVQTLLTGNIAPVARIKLDVLDMLDTIVWEYGAYGNDEHDRMRLVAVAVARVAEQSGQQFAPHQVVVVGDTPNDVRCGHLNGARSVVVATGPYPLEDLQATGADACLPDMGDVAAACAAILGD